MSSSAVLKERAIAVAVATDDVKESTEALQQRRFEPNLVALQVSGLCQTQHREQHARLVWAEAVAATIDVQIAECMEVAVEVRHGFFWFVVMTL